MGTSAVIKCIVTIVESVPSHTHILLDELEKNKAQYDLSALRYYVSNGEAMPKTQMQRWFKILPEVGLVNTYGATECSDDVSHFHLKANNACKTPYIPTKGVLGNLKLYLLDALMNPVPIGVVGEVYVGGVGVGRGYFKDEERTKAAFILNPFEHNKERMYRTGDLARYHANGEMEFIGRADFQVKIRGFRVEVGEVESALTQHPNVKQTLILARKDKKGIQHLIAYIVPHTHPAPSVNELSQFCLRKLPHYMVPSAFILLDTFPLSANGKIDRKQLPEPNERDLTKDQDYIAPRNELEQTLANIWSEVLGLEKVGIRDNFFQIGGHSLLAVDVINKTQQNNLNLELRHLFDRPTIEHLAEVLA